MMTPAGHTLLDRRARGERRVLTQTSPWTMRRSVLDRRRTQTQVAAEFVMVAAEQLRADKARLREALREIMESCAEHPLFMGITASAPEMLREGGDAASVTYWHHVAREVLRETK